MKRLSKSIQKTTSTITKTTSSIMPMRDTSSSSNTIMMTDHSSSTSLDGSFRRNSNWESAAATMTKREFQRELRKEMKDYKKTRVKSFQQKKALLTMGDIDEVSEQARRAEAAREKKRRSSVAQPIKGASHDDDDDQPSTPLTVCSTTRGSIPNDLEITITLPDLQLVEQADEEDEEGESKEAEECLDTETATTTTSQDNNNKLSSISSSQTLTQAVGKSSSNEQPSLDEEDNPQSSAMTLHKNPSTEPTLAPLLQRGPSALLAKPKMTRRNTTTGNRNTPPPLMLRRMATSFDQTSPTSNNNPLALWTTTAPIDNTKIQPSSAHVVKKKLQLSRSSSIDSSIDASELELATVSTAPSTPSCSVTTVLSCWDDEMSGLEHANQALQQKIQQLESQLHDTEQDEVEQVWLIKGTLCPAKKDEIREQLTREHQQQLEQLHPQLPDDPEDPQLVVLQKQRSRQQALIDALYRENKARRHESQAVNLHMLQLLQSNMRMRRATQATLDFVRELQLVHVREYADRNKTLLRELQAYSRKQVSYEQYDIPKAVAYRYNERRIRKIYVRGTERLVQYVLEECFDRSLIACITEMPPAVVSTIIVKKQPKRGDRR
ncbi:expressed unknown protein [Seminavis robusta]|uniref:Uncharacterized protein n=1 Tax=Seminavis robusta TaxID=568900 RepID=A0A9N8DAT0_9STRA|nr:expressed unknown protein [Seminavis robusta]|eukprot:Sro64_g036310.1 n/a (607) ;mRNA; f:77045-78865